MSVTLTNAQWAALQGHSPLEITDPSRETTFVPVRADIYERFKSLFEEDPVTERERMFHLQQFGRRAGWDDPEMDVYDEG